MFSITITLSGPKNNPDIDTKDISQCVRYVRWYKQKTRPWDTHRVEEKVVLMSHCISSEHVLKYSDDNFHFPGANYPTFADTMIDELILQSPVHRELTRKLAFDPEGAKEKEALDEAVK